jgi:hypothetical protein
MMHTGPSMRAHNNEIHLLVAGNVYDSLKGDAMHHQDLPCQPGILELFVLCVQTLLHLGLQFL